VIVVEPPAGRLAHARAERQQREQRRDRERHLHGRGEAAPLAPAEPAQPDLRTARQEPHAPQCPVDPPLTADGRAGGVQRVGERQARRAPDGGQRGQRRAGQADDQAGHEDRDRHPEARLDAEPELGEVLHKRVGEHDAEPRSEHGADRAQ
jgi:hypothetical protein